MCLIINIRIPVGLFRYQQRDHGEKYKVTRFNGQAFRSGQVTSGKHIVRLVQQYRIVTKYYTSNVGNDGFYLGNNYYYYCVYAAV